MEITRKERRISSVITAVLLFLTVVSVCFALQKEVCYAADPAYVTIKVKVQDAVDKTPLEGHKIQLYNKLSQSVYLENGDSFYGKSTIEATTGSDGVAVFTGIPVYCVDRYDSVLRCEYSISYSSYLPFDDPYYHQKAADIAPIDVTPVDGEKPDNIYEYTYSLKKKAEYVKVRVKKIDGDTGEPLKGAGIDVINGGVFGGEIVLADGTVVPHMGVIQHIVTDENGMAETDQIIPNTGQFYIEVVEKEAPEGYFLDDRRWRIYGSGPYALWGGDFIYDVTVRNYRLSEKGGLSIEKRFIAGDMENKAEFEITLKDKNGDPVNDSFDFALGYQDLPKITFVDGKARVTLDASDGYKVYNINNIPVGYTYEIREIPANGWSMLGGEVKKGTIEPNANYLDGYSAPVNRLLLANAKERSPKAASFTLQAEKKMQNKDLNEGEFSFELKQDGKVIETAKNDKDGKVSFKAIDVDPEDIRSEVTYLEATDEQKSMVKEWFLIPEASDYRSISVFTDDIPGDASTYIVEDDPYSSWGGSSSIVYYKDATEEQKKWAVEHRATWRLDDDFGVEFQNVAAVADTLSDEEKANLIGICYDKTMTYTINEVLPSGVSESSPKKDGIVYDTHEEKVKVRITGSSGGELKATISYDEDGSLFTNKYEEVNKGPAKELDSNDEGDNDDSSTGNEDGSPDDNEKGYNGVRTGDQQKVMGHLLLLLFSVALLASAVKPVKKK